MMKQKIRRKLIQIAAFGFTNCHAGNFITGKLYNGRFKNFCTPGLNCYSCPAASVSCPIGALLAITGRADLKFSFYVWGFILAIGALIGRAVCAFLCPFGLIQELIALIPVKKFNLPKPLTYVKYIILALGVIVIPLVLVTTQGSTPPIYCKYICPAGTLEAGIPMLLTHSNLSNSIGPLFYVKLGILIAVILGCVLIKRFFCKLLCPLGAIYGLFNRFALVQLQYDSETCVRCGACESVCPMGIDPKTQFRSMECIRCGRCARVCPKGSLAVRFGIGEVHKKSTM